MAAALKTSSETVKALTLHVKYGSTLKLKICLIFCVTIQYRITKKRCAHMFRTHAIVNKDSISLIDCQNSLLRSSGCVFPIWNTFAATNYSRDAISWQQAQSIKVGNMIE